MLKAFDTLTSRLRIVGGLLEVVILEVIDGSIENKRAASKRDECI